MSNLVHIASSLMCTLPEVEFHQNRNSFNVREALDHLWMMLEDFGQRFCMYGCATCGDRMHEDEERDLGNGHNLTTCFAKAHNAIGQLPDNIYQHLLSLTNGDCPICATLTALKQFTMIADHADTRPLDWYSLPCHFEQATSDTGYNYQERIRHIQALSYLDIASLPSRLTPADRHDIKTRLAPGKSVVDFIRGFLDGRIQLRSSMTDDDLWDLLFWHPDDECHLPTSEWKSWAKTKILAANELSPSEYLCQIAMIAQSCFDNLLDTRITRDGFNKNDGIRDNELQTLFVSGMYLCGIHPSNEDFQNALTQAEYNEHYFISTQWCDCFHLNGWYYRLTFVGKKESEKIGGKAPLFFEWEVAAEYEDEQREKKRQTIPQNATVPPDSTVFQTARNDANATGIGIATGGTGGNAAVTFEREAVKPVAKIESGAVKVEANPTINMPSLDVVGVVSQFKEGMMEAFREGGKHVVQEPKENTASDAKKGNRGRPSDTDKEYDARHAAGWEQYRAAKKTKAEYAEDNSMTVSELDAILGRQRKR